MEVNALVEKEKKNRKERNRMPEVYNIFLVPQRQYSKGLEYLNE